MEFKARKHWKFNAFHFPWVMHLDHAFNLTDEYTDMQNEIHIIHDHINKLSPKRVSWGWGKFFMSSCIISYMQHEDNSPKKKAVTSSQGSHHLSFSLH